MAECHPVGFRWVMKARENGATIIHVDPRFTRTSAVANMHVPIRAGSDIAFLGGIIKYILDNERYFREYVVNFTNASAIISRGVRGFRGAQRFVQRLGRGQGQVRQHPGCTRTSIRNPRRRARNWAEAQGNPTQRQPIQAEHVDHTLQHPRCVFQILKRHYARYTPEMVEETCGIPKDLFLKVAETFCRNSGRERTTAFCYAVGWTQHSVGVQYIRAAAIIQLLLGNMGRPGGGIMALRGHASIQGSTDIPTLYNLLPGYLPMPKAQHDKDLATYLKLNDVTLGMVGRVS